MKFPAYYYENWVIYSLLFILVVLLLIIPGCLYFYYYIKYRKILPAQPEAASLYAIIIYYSIITFFLLFATTYSYTCELVYLFVEPFLGIYAGPVFEILQYVTLGSFFISTFSILRGIETRLVRLDILYIICIYIFAFCVIILY